MKNYICNYRIGKACTHEDRGTLGDFPSQGVCNLCQGNPATIVPPKLDVLDKSFRRFRQTECIPCGKSKK